MIITIDGPTASGKSTVAKMLAQELNYDYLYTGLLYRAISYILVTYFGYTIEDLENPLKEDVQNILSGDLVYEYDHKQGALVKYKGKDITRFLKTADVDSWSSRISANKMLRECLIDFQRSYARKHNTVVEGRDIGSVVFPEAKHKFFITASLNERARRWRQDQRKLKNVFSQEESIEQVKIRDDRDSNRKVSPLIIPQDAIVIDSTFLDIRSTIEEIKKYLNIND